MIKEGYLLFSLLCSSNYCEQEGASYYVPDKREESSGLVEDYYVLRLYDRTDRVVKEERIYSLPGIEGFLPSDALDELDANDDRKRVSVYVDITIDPERVELFSSSGDMLWSMAKEELSPVIKDIEIQEYDEFILVNIEIEDSVVPDYEYGVSVFHTNDYDGDGSWEWVLFSRLGRASDTGELIIEVPRELLAPSLTRSSFSFLVYRGLDFDYEASNYFFKEPLSIKDVETRPLVANQLVINRGSPLRLRVFLKGRDRKEFSASNIQWFFDGGDERRLIGEGFDIVISTNDYPVGHHVFLVEAVSDDFVLGSDSVAVFIYKTRSRFSGFVEDSNSGCGNLVISINNGDLAMQSAFIRWRGGIRSVLRIEDFPISFSLLELDEVGMLVGEDVLGQVARLSLDPAKWGCEI